METEEVLDFLRYGGDPTCIAALPVSCTAPFLPSLALLASDSPSFSCPLLASHPLAPSALAYASLDFSPISHAALRLLKEDTPLNEEPLCNTPLDESVCFNSSDQKERAKNVIFLLHRRASKYMGLFQTGKELDKAWHRQQNDAGSIWNSKSCLSELTCLLPIATSRCPKLLFPEDFVWGLLPTQWGFILLSYILLNNPLLVRKSLFLLSDFLRTREISIPSSEHVLLSAQSHKQGQQNRTELLCVKQAVLTFLQLGKLSSSLAHSCREVLVMSCACAGVAMYLTAEYIHDEFDFLSKIIFSNTKTSEWMLGYFRSAKKDHLEDFIRVIESAEVTEGFFFQSATKSDASIHFQGGSLRVRKALLVEARNTKEKYGWCGQLHGHLRLYCVLIEAAKLQPMPEELEFWLQTLIDAEGSICEQTLRLGVSFFCLVPGLTTNTVIKSLFYKCVAALLKWKVLAQTRFTSELDEQTVWFAVQLFLRQFSEIAMVVREVMGMHMTVENASFKELYDAAMAVEVISEPSMLMEAVVALRPKGPMSSKARHGHYTLECLEQLLRSGHLSRNGVDVSESILHCISVSATPIHGLLIQVIQAYTEAPAAIVHGSTGSHPFRMLPLPCSFLEDSMVTIPSLTSDMERDGIDHGKVETTADTFVREALTSYYILCRERVLRSKGAGSSESSLTAFFSPPDCKGSWWIALLSRLPFHQLLHHMEKRWLDFARMFPQWLSLAASLFPERFVVPDLLASLIEPFSWTKDLAGGLASEDKEMSSAFSECFKSTDIQAHESGVILNMDLARTALENALVDPLPALQILDHLTLKSSVCKRKLSKELIDYQRLFVKELVPKLLNPLCKRCLQEKFCTWFKNLQPLVRQTLLPAFVEVILDTTQEENDIGLVMEQLKAMKAESNIRRIETYSNLVQQPLILLACKLKVYRTPLISTVLDVLHELRTINHRVCVELVSERVSREQSLTSEEVSSALLAQDSAMCQILLEACLPNMGLGDNLEPGPLLETRKMICGFLAPLLESNHVLLKLLHFQGYDPQLVSVMVKGVPAMVQCLNFMPEFLQQQPQSKQVFTINTIANIACTHVELPESVAAVQKAVAHVRNARGTSSFMQGVLGAMAECACAFSDVAADIVNILQDCMKSSSPSKPGGLPRDPMLYSATLSAFKHLAHRRVSIGPSSNIPLTTIPAALHEA